MDNVMKIFMGDLKGSYKLSIGVCVSPTSSYRVTGVLVDSLTRLLLAWPAVGRYVHVSYFFLITDAVLVNHTIRTLKLSHLSNHLSNNKPHPSLLSTSCTSVSG